MPHTPSFAIPLLFETTPPSSFFAPLRVQKPRRTEGGDACYHRKKEGCGNNGVAGTVSRSRKLKGWLVSMAKLPPLREKATEHALRICKIESFVSAMPLSQRVTLCCWLTTTHISRPLILLSFFFFREFWQIDIWKNTTFKILRDFSILEAEIFKVNGEKRCRKKK